MQKNKVAPALAKYILLFFILFLSKAFAYDLDLFSLQQGKGDISIEQGKTEQEVHVEFHRVEDVASKYQYQLFYRKISLVDNSEEVIKGSIREQAIFSIRLETLYAYEVSIAVLSDGVYLFRTPVEIIKPGDFVPVNHSASVDKADVSDSSTFLYRDAFSDTAVSDAALSDSAINSTLKIDSDSFPFLFLESAIDFNGIPYDGDPNNLPILTKDNFTITEDGRVQTVIGVTPPSGESSGNKIADILFVHDDSGSLDDEAAQVKANITSFVNQLAGNNIDFRVGLLPYGGGGGFSSPSGTLLNGGLLHDNSLSFTNDIDSMRFDGSTERAFDAMHLGASQTTWRQSTQKIIVLVTDENNDSGNINEATVTQTLKDNGVTVYGLTRGHSEFDRIATATGGKVFNITSDFSPILAEIGNTIGASYIVRYKTDNPNLDGQKRAVEVKINAEDQQGATQETIVTGEYVAAPPVGIGLTSETQTLSSKGQRQGASLPILAKITRNDIVDTSINASLFYKHATDSAYNSVVMTHISNGIYEAAIPSNIILEPYISYYISASDGSSTVTYPSSDPGNKPQTISILPNIPPTIQHAPLFSSVENKEILISAQVEDVTNQVDSVSIFYRKAGESIYNEVGSSFGAPIVSFSNYIPASATQDTDFLEYYIEAKDDFGVEGQYGSASSPLRVYIARAVTVSDHRDVGNIRVYANSFLDENEAPCTETGYELCTASGSVSIGTINGKALLSFESSLQLQENAEKITSLNSGKIIALNIKKNVSREVENIPLYESNLEIDASGLSQDAEMKILGGRSILQLLGTVNLKSAGVSLISIKDDELIIHNVLADIDQYITTLVTIGDVVLSQVGNSTGEVTFTADDVLDQFPIVLPSCGSGGSCNTQWSLGGLELTLDLINSAIIGKASISRKGILGDEKNGVSVKLGFLTNPFALETIGGGISTPTSVFTIPLSPPSPIGAGFNSFDLEWSNISSSTSSKVKATGGFKLTDAGRILEGIEKTVKKDLLNGEVVLLIDLSGRVDISGDLKLLDFLPLAEAKLSVGNPTSLEAKLMLDAILIKAEGRAFYQIGYTNSYVSMNGKTNADLELAQAVPWIGGANIAGATLLGLFEFTPGNIRKAILTTDVELFFIDVGIRLDVSDVLSPHLYLRGWNKEVTVFRPAADTKLLSRATTPEKVSIPVGLDYAVIKVESDTSAAIFDLVMPDGTIFTPDSAPANQSSSNIDKVFFVRNENANEAFYAIKSPEAGEYEAVTTNASDLGDYSVNLYTPNEKPSINLLSQASDVTWDGVSPIVINWEDSDVDNNAEVSLYYDTNNSGLDGVLIESGIFEDDMGDNFTWNISQSIPASGDYYIYALIDDGEHTPISSYSIGRVRVENPQAPAAPSSFIVQEGDGSVTAAWDANSESNLMGYRLYVSETPEDGIYEYDFATGVNTSWTIPSLENGKTYEIALAAINTDNLESLKTQAVTFTPTGSSTGGSPDLTVDVANSSFDSPTGKYEGEIVVVFRITNQGQYPAYTAKIDTYLGGMKKEQLLETKTVSSIEPGDFIDIEYKYNIGDLSDVELGRNIYVDIRDVQLPELNTRNNIVSLKNKLDSPNPYDLDSSGDVDEADIMKVATAWNSKVGDENYNAAYDFNDDSSIDIKDVMIVASNWGK